MLTLAALNLMQAEMDALRKENQELRDALQAKEDELAKLRAELAELEAALKRAQEGGGDNDFYERMEWEKRIRESLRKTVVSVFPRVSGCRLWFDLSVLCDLPGAGGDGDAWHADRLGRAPCRGAEPADGCAHLCGQAGAPQAPLPGAAAGRECRHNMSTPSRTRV
jgi:hypothetical protein